MKSRSLLESIPNVRDLGGIRCGEDKIVRFGCLLRGGVMRHLAPEDEQLLKLMGLRRVIDMRTERERIEKPNKLIDGVEYIHCPILTGPTEGVTHELPEDRELEAQRTILMAKRLLARHQEGREQLKYLYRLFITEEYATEHFRQFFDILLNADGGASYIQCMMGKDRTGTAVALLLYALGADRESIMADYLITAEQCLPGTEDLLERCRRYTDDEEVLKMIFFLDTAEEEFLNAAFSKAEELYGSVDAYLRDALGLDEKKLEKLRSMYLVSVQES